MQNATHRHRPRPVIQLLGCAMAAMLGAAAPGAQAAAVFWEPTPYLSTADIPLGFYAGNVPGFLDTLEDGNLGGQLSTDNGAVIGPGTFDGVRDSVDADDGSIDGTGVAGSSFFYLVGTQGIVITFNSSQLPSSFGLAWTDGGGDVTFSAVDGNGVSLGSITRSGLGDAVNNGTTGEDRFFGVQSVGGIRSISISNASGGIEIDHIQYGIAPVPEPTSAALMLAGMGLLAWRRLRRPG